MDSTHIEQEQMVALLRDAAQAIRSVMCSPADKARALSAARNVLEVELADTLAEMDATKAHEQEGCASVATWAARELNQDVSTTRQMVRASKTMRVLPSIAESVRTGRVSLDHVHALTFGLKHVGHDEITGVETELRTLAEGMTSRDLFAQMRILKAIAHSDELDEAWLRGQEKRFIECLKTLDGYHVRGFLPTDVGAKFKVYLDAVAVPRDADDLRTAAQRKVDGLDDLLTKALGDGLPGAGGVKPHVSVVVQAEKLQKVLTGRVVEGGQQPLDLDAEPTILEGFGPIGPALLAYIAYGGNLTPILVAGFKENRKVLDAGRHERVATTPQRRMISYRQKGRCANRGCHHPIGEVHHVIAWADGGKTNIDNLAGLCRKCHTLVTMDRLTMSGTFETGYTFTTSRDRPLARTG